MSSPLDDSLVLALNPSVAFPFHLWQSFGQPQLHRCWCLFCLNVRVRQLAGEGHLANTYGPDLLRAFQLAEVFEELCVCWHR
jgi:hypothetical protein